VEEGKSRVPLSTTSQTWWQTTRMWPSAPKAIPSWIPQAQIGYQGIHTSKKGLWVQVQHHCLCPQAFCANSNHSAFIHS
jgi:hypothetical protein